MAATSEDHRKDGFLLTDRSIVNINGQRAILQVDTTTGGIRVFPLDKGIPLSDEGDQEMESSTHCLSELNAQKALPGLGLAQADCGIVDAALLPEDVKHSVCPPHNQPDVTLTSQPEFTGAAHHHSHIEPHVISGTLSDPSLGTATEDTVLAQDPAEVPLAKFRSADEDLTPLRGVEQHLERDVLEQDLLEQFLSCVTHDFPFSSSTGSSTVALDPPNNASIEPGLFLTVGSAAKSVIATSTTSTVVDHALKVQSTSSYAFFMDAELKSVDHGLASVEQVAGVTNVAHTDTLPIAQTEGGKVSAFGDWTFPDSDNLQSCEAQPYHRPVPLFVAHQPKHDATEEFRMKSNSNGTDVTMHLVKKRGRKPKLRVAGRLGFTKLKPLRPKPTAQSLFLFNMASTHSAIPTVPSRPVPSPSIPATNTNSDKPSLHLLMPYMPQPQTTSHDSSANSALSMQQQSLALLADVLPAMTAKYTQAVSSDTCSPVQTNSRTTLIVCDSVGKANDSGGRASDSGGGTSASPVTMNNSDVRVTSSDPTDDVSDLIVGVRNSAVEVSNSVVGVSKPAVGVSNSVVGVTNSAVGVSSSAIGVSSSAIGMSNSVVGVSSSALGVSSSAVGASNSAEITSITSTCPACHLTVPTIDLQSHLLTHRTVCVVCEAVFEREEQLFEHLTRHNIRVVLDADRSTEFQCSICGSHFLHAGNVQRHVLSHCESTAPSVMLTLGEYTLNGEALHVKKAAPHPKKLICHKCGKLLGPKSLVAHVKSHCPADDPDRHTNPVQCTECRNLFRNLTTLKRHLASCRRRMTGTSMENVVTCEACFKSVSVHSLATHKRLHCTAAEPDSQSCLHCGTVLKHKHSLRNHIKWHCRKSPLASSPTKCTCGKVFRNYKAFQSHYQNHCLVRGPANV